MKKYLVIAILFITSFAAIADENTSVDSNKGQYQECVAVSLYTMQGRELNSIVDSDRKIKETTVVPKGWSVIGVTTKTEAGLDAPYMVICH